MSESKNREKNEAVCRPHDSGKGQAQRLELPKVTCENVQNAKLKSTGQ